MKERLPYIDVAKGIMILMVVLHHLPQYAMRVLSVENDFLMYSDGLSKYYAGFFMQAFFFVSGYCSNFNKDFKPFLKSNCKSIIIPMLLFYMLCHGIIGLLHLDFSWLNSFFSIKFWLYFVEDYWFFSALFIMRIVFYLINKHIKDRRTLWCVIMILMLICIGLNNRTDIEDPSHYHNFWHYRNAFSMLPFLAIGHSLKGVIVKERTLALCGVCYFAICVILSFGGFAIPQFTHRCLVSVYQIPLFLSLALLGTGMMLGVAKLIGRNRFLEFVGRNSLIVYATQIMCLDLTERLYIRLFDPPSTYLDGVIFYMSVATMAIVMCSFFAYVFSIKQLSFFTGKW